MCQYCRKGQAYSFLSDVSQNMSNMMSRNTNYRMAHPHARYSGLYAEGEVDYVLSELENEINTTVDV